MAAPYVQYPVAYFRPLDLDKQSIEVPGTKRPGQTAHYRNASHPLVDLKYARTLHNLQEAFQNGLALAGPNAPCLGDRKLLERNPVRWSDTITWQSWKTVDARRHALGSGLHKLFEDGIVGGRELHTVGIWSRNTSNWQLIELSLPLYNLASVALYDTLGPDAVEYIINHAETSIVFASPQNAMSLLKMSSKIPCVKVVVLMEDETPEVVSVLSTWGHAQGIRVMTFTEIEVMGKAHPCKPFPPSSEAIATICYTSGTTGAPKGAIITQGSLAVGTHCMGYGGDLGNEPFLLFSYLPLAHIYERTMEVITIMLGGAIAYGTGDPLRLIEDIQLIRPSLLPSVPRVMNRVVSAAMATSTAGGLKGALFNRALQAKLANFHKNGVNTHMLWDRLVFSKIQAVLGGRLRLLGLGSAPMNAASLDFLKIALACDVSEGSYGATETCGSGTRTYPQDPKSSGFIGAPSIGVELKMIDVPSLGYGSEDKPRARGEICIRGTTVFSGYLKDEKNTKAAIDEEGWYHTGDVGEIDAHGRFKIIDRVKNIMKLAQGEYVAIERIESLYSGSPYVAQLFVYGDSLQSYLVAILVPDPIRLATVASSVWEKTISSDDQEKLDEVTRDPQVLAVLLKELDKEAEKNGLRGFERIKRMFVTLKPFTVEDGTLTPTFKMRRKDAYVKFKKEIDGMYSLPEPGVRSQL